MHATPTQPSLACADSLLLRALGRPWEALAIGPDAYDCWGFAWALRRAVGLPLPRLPALTPEERQGFRRLPEPVPFCLVVMGLQGEATHVGVYHPSGTVYHSVEGRGVHGVNLKVLQQLFQTLQFWEVTDDLDHISSERS